MGRIERLASVDTGYRENPSSSNAATKHAEVLRGAFKGPLHPGNRITVLLDGPATYAAMFEAIDQARDHINLESYMVEAEGPGEELARRLTARCKDGIKVNLLFDSFGSLGTAATYFEDLRCAGVNLCEYNPLRRWTTLLSRAFHLRDHRKLMVVDGRIGFIGGVNISHVYSSGSASSSPSGGSDNPAGWRDTHVRVEGPVVAELQRLFLRQWWRFARHPVQHGRYFPPLKPVGTHRAAVVASDAGRRRNLFYRTLLNTMELAQERILLTSAYFVPTRRLLRTLIRASRRGVKVHLVLPGISDFWAPLQAGRSHYSRLLRAGIRIHERHDRLLHAKTTVIDGLWSTVGSSNLDWRSFLHNAEANIVVLDAGFGAQVEEIFWNDVALSEEITLDRWSKRGFLQRLKEIVARRFEFFL